MAGGGNDVSVAVGKEAAPVTPGVESTSGGTGDQGQGKQESNTNNKKKKQKDELKCGENGTYGDLKKKTGHGEFDRDHVPSKAALKEYAKQEFAGKEKLCPDQKKAIDNLASAIAIPKWAHKLYSPTYGGRNTGDLVGKDIKNLQTAARRDTANVLRGMRKNGVSKECQKAYAEWAKKVNSTTHQQYHDWLKKASGK